MIPTKYGESPNANHIIGRGFVRFEQSDRSSLEDPKIQSEILDPPRGCQMDGSWGATLFNPLGFKHHPLDGAGTFMVGVFFWPFQNEHIPTPGLLLISQCFCGFGGLGMNLSNLVTLEKKTPRKNSLTFLHLFHEITSKVLFCRFSFSDVCQVEYDGFQVCLKMLKKTLKSHGSMSTSPQRWPHQPDPRIELKWWLLPSRSFSQRVWAPWKVTKGTNRKPEQSGTNHHFSGASC